MSNSTSTQTIFSRAVKHHLHDGFVSLLDRIDEFNLGAVFTLHEKHHFWAFWRRKELDFTGAHLSHLLAKGDGSDEARVGFTFKSEKKTLFDATSDTSQRTVDIDLDLDGEVKAAVVDLGGNVGGSGKKIVKISVELGSLDHITSNMYEAIGSSLSADLEHPIIREAMDKGRTLFVISSIYQSERVDISVTREEDASMKAEEKVGDEPTTTTTPSTKTETTDGTGATTDTTTDTTTGTTTGTTTDTTGAGSGGATASGVESTIENVVGKVEDVGKDLATKGLGIPEGEESVTGDAKSKTTGITVTKRDRLSNIGFSVLRLEIGKDGTLSPQARIGVSSDHKIHASYADAFLASGGATATGDDQRGLEPPSDTTPPKEDDKDTPKEEDSKGTPKEGDTKDAPKEEDKDTPKEGDSEDTPKEDGKDAPKDEEEEHTTSDKDGTATD